MGNVSKRQQPYLQMLKRKAVYGPPMNLSCKTQFVYTCGFYLPSTYELFRGYSLFCKKNQVKFSIAYIS